MGGRGRTIGIVGVTLAAVATGACSADPGATAGTATPIVTTASAAGTTAPPTTAAVSGTVTTTDAPTTDAPTTTEPDDGGIGEPTVELPVELTLAAGDQSAVVRPIPVASPDPATGYDGFHSAVRLDSGRWVAVGYDAEGDGRQPERSGVWVSDDGQRWERVGLEISRMPGQQTLRSVLQDPVTGAVHIIGADLGVADVGRSSRADAYVFTSIDDGMTWDRELIAPNVFPVDALMTDDGPLIAAVDGSQAEPIAVVFRRASVRWQRSVLPAPDGGFDRSSSVWRMIRTGNSLLAVGARTTTDPDVDTTPPMDLLEPVVFPPSDVAIWKSDDGGVTWATWSDEQFRGTPGTQEAIQIANTQAGLVLAVNGSDLAPPARRTTSTTLWRADGEGWSPFPVDLGLAPSGYPPGVWLSHHGGGFSGGLVVVSTVYTKEDPSVASVSMTLVDTETLEQDTIAVTTRSRFQQAEDIVMLDDGTVWIFGRLERGVGVSDLQVMELDVETVP